jgi:hypothetical protein
MQCGASRALDPGATTTIRIDLNDVFESARQHADAIRRKALQTVSIGSGGAMSFIAITPLKIQAVAASVARA